MSIQLFNFSISLSRNSPGGCVRTALPPVPLLPRLPPKPRRPTHPFSKIRAVIHATWEPRWYDEKAMNSVHHLIVVPDELPANGRTFLIEKIVRSVFQTITFS